MSSPRRSLDQRKALHKARAEAREYQKRQERIDRAMAEGKVTPEMVADLRKEVDALKAVLDEIKDPAAEIESMARELESIRAETRRFKIACSDPKVQIEGSWPNFTIKVLPRQKFRRS